MNLDTLNRYLLGVIGVFAVLLYIGMMFAGASELISRLPKRGRRKRQKVGTSGRSMRTAKKSI